MEDESARASEMERQLLQAEVRYKTALEAGQKDMKETEKKLRSDFFPTCFAKADSKNALASKQEAISDSRK